MGGIIKHTGSELKGRWHQKMPRFFYWMVVVATGIGGLFAAINLGVPALGGTLHEWWSDLYTYIISACIGVIFTCKFTVAGGYRHINPDNLTSGHRVLSHDADECPGGGSPMQEEEETVSS